MDFENYLKVYIIHVKGNTSRKKYIENQLDKIFYNYEFILKGNIEDLDKYVLNRYFTGQMKKEIAVTSCATKHLVSYERLINSKAKYALILEDDIKLFKNFNSIFEKSIKVIKDNNLSNILISYEDSNLKYVKRSEKEKGKLLYKKQKGRLAGAYLIDKSAAKNMINYIINEKYDKPIDWFHNHCAKKNLINIYWSSPAIARQASLTGDLPSLLTDKRTNSLKRKIDFNLQKIYKKILYFFR